MLFIETQIRDDQIRLVGFMSEVEREWFRLLLTVQGVGSKVALAMLGTLKVVRPRLGRRAAGQGDDRARARRRPEGRGAHRAELKDKAPALSGIDMGVSGCNRSSATRSRRGRRATPSPRWSISATAQTQASAAIAAALREAGEGAETARLIRLGLRELAR